MAPFSVAATGFEPRPLLANEWMMILFYVAGVLYWGYRFRAQASENPAESFLAGRSIPGWIASCSTVASNLNANDFLGWAGAVYLVGVVMVHFPLHTAIVICFSGLVVMRKLRAAKVYTLGGWLAKRYSPLVGNIYNIAWILVWMPFGLGLYIYAGSLILHTLVGWPLGISIVLVTTIAAVYTLMGGFRAVVATDVIQLFFMLFPLVVVCIILWLTVGGPLELLQKIPSPQASLWSSDTPFGPIGFLFFGHLAMALTFWSCDAQLVQRPLSTRNDSEAAVAYLGAGFWYALLVPLIAIFPGLAAIACFPDLDKADYAAPMILREYLPPGLYGVAIVGLLSGVFSSVDSTLNAFCTMFTRDIYVGIWNPAASDKIQLRVSHYAGIGLTLIGILTAYYFSLNDSMFVSIAKIISFLMPPLGAVTVLGACWKRCSYQAALIGLGAGYASAMLLALLDQQGQLSELAAEPAFFNALINFTITVLVVGCVSLAVPHRQQTAAPATSPLSIQAKWMSVTLLLAIGLMYGTIMLLL